MSTLDLVDTTVEFVVLYYDCKRVPMSYPLGNDRVVRISFLRLSLPFRLSEEFMYIDEEVYDAYSKDLIYTFNQSLKCEGDSKEWLSSPGRYLIYDMSESIMAPSTELVTFHQSSTSTVQLTFTTWVKVEHAKELITILSDDSDRNSPIVAPPITSPLINIFLLDSSQRSCILLNHPEPHVGHQKSLTIVDSLKRLQALKGTQSKVLIMIVLTSKGCSSFHQPLMGKSSLSCL